jgi:hypothetical protein
MNISSLIPPVPAHSKPTPSAPSLNTASDSAPAEDVEVEFLAYARMSPAERMRASILKSMGLSEDDLNAMSPQDRQKVENTIEEMIKQQMEEAQKKKGQLLDVAA